MKKQITIIKIASKLFKGSKPLGNKETEILNKALKKSVSNKPTKL
jgi:hypothetical protein